MKTTIATLTTALTLSLTLTANAGHCRTGNNFHRPVQHRPVYRPVHNHRPVIHHRPVQIHRPVIQQHRPLVHHVRPQQRYCTVLPRQAKCFTHYCQLGKYNCRGMYSPEHQEWFYYYAPKQCYVPVKYIDQLPPNVNLNNNDNRNDNDNLNDNRNNNQNITNINIGPGLLNSLQPAAPQAVPAPPAIGEPIQQADGTLVLPLPPAAE